MDGARPRKADTNRNLDAILDSIDAFDGLPLDYTLASSLWSTGLRYTGRPLLAALPSFKSYQSDEIATCAGAGAFPAFSITGGACALGCAHCEGRILEPMIPASTPEAFERTVRAMHERQGLRGLLLSGGSNKRNEVPFERYLPAVQRLKADFPSLEVAVHTALADERRANLLKAANVDVAMLDIIGAEETIRQVYRLDRPVADFEASLSTLVSAGLDVVPHIVIGLHFGRLLGEAAALEIIARHKTRAVILVVLMPHLTIPGQFATPAAEDVARTILLARDMLPDRQLLLGCARPAGIHRRLTDAYAILAGIDGIAHPADGSVSLARMLGRTLGATPSCCGIDRCRTERSS